MIAGRSVSFFESDELIKIGNKSIVKIRKSQFQEKTILRRECLGERLLDD
jgi:hypothetical protein